MQEEELAIWEAVNQLGLMIMASQGVDSLYNQTYTWTGRELDVVTDWVMPNNSNSQVQQ